MALPFGVFEHVLSLAANRPAARQYEELTRNLEDDSSDAKTLTQLREIIQVLAAPTELLTELRETFAARRAGLAER